jgi:hypothetical protein
VGFDNSPLYVALKTPAYTTPTVLASGLEARLIEAEAALRGGGGNWLGTLNDLRAAPPEYYPAELFPSLGLLQPLADPGSAGARVDLLFRERAHWLYLTGHRLGDLRRLVRQYSRTADSVFPTGRWGVWSSDKSGDYGTDVNFPIPFDELNNPNFQGCLNMTREGGVRSRARELGPWQRLRPPVGHEPAVRRECDVAARVTTVRPLHLPATLESARTGTSNQVRVMLE